jgi:hypothetical protein
VSLLVRLTDWPVLPAAAFNVTVQVSAALPRMDPFAQLNAVSIGTPVPLRLTSVELPFDALLAMVSWPLAAPEAVGSNWMVTVTLALAPNVMGMAPDPLSEKGCPVRLICETSTAADPWFESVITLLTVLPTATWPKSTALADTESAPAAELLVTNDPEHPLRARPQIKVSSPMKLNFKWRILPSGRAQNLHRRAYVIYRQGIRR